MSSDATPSDADSISTLTDPEAVRDRTDVTGREHARTRDDRDHCGTSSAGQAVVGVRNDAGEVLLLVNREIGIAVLPHGTVPEEGDWAETARTDAAATTGIEFALQGVELVRRVEHRLEGEDGPHAVTHQVVFRGSAAGGTIDDCKRSPEAGSDAWTAGWYDGLPDGIDAPEGVSGEDLRLFL